MFETFGKNANNLKKFCRAPTLRLVVGWNTAKKAMFLPIFAPIINNV